ncbi:MAG: antitoxin [Chloroflexota bacterium]|nr:antitoxin [Chloroflexota bacterium]
MIPPYHFLAQQLREEWDNLERVIRIAQRSMAGAERHPGDQDVYIGSAALNLHGFYSGVEKMFLSIAEQVDDSVPVGSRWHTDLLNQMTYDLPNVRPPVLSRAARDALRDYRSFRHLVRNIYTYNLNPEKVKVLVDHLPDVWVAVKQDVERFLAFLDAVAQAEVEEG